MLECKSIDNVFDVSIEEENYRKIDGKMYAEFKSQLNANPLLYQSGNSYYIRIKYSDENTKSIYNTIKNELMSYMDKYDFNNKVKNTLHENREEFYIGNTVAQLRISGGTLRLYLALDPSKYSTNDAIHKNVGDDLEFEQTPFLLELTKQSRTIKSISAIANAMAEAGCIKDTSHVCLDYASYYTRQTIIAKRSTGTTQDDVVNEEAAQKPLFAFDTQNESISSVIINQIDDIQAGDVLEIVETKEMNFNEDSSEDQTSAEQDVEGEHIFDEDIPVYVYENISAPTDRPVFRDLKNIDKPLVEAARAPIQNTIFDKNEDEQKKGNNAKKSAAHVWDELEDYGYHFTPLKQLIFYFIAIALAIAMGILYKLNILFIAILILAATLMMPGVLSAYYKQKYEEKRFSDAEAYIEQMLYSFRRNSKIIVSLRDALVIFPSGYMHDKIVEAMDYIRNSGDDPDTYANALAVIENAYPCRRIKSLHRFMIKVEDIGGKHEAGIQALLDDRRLWIDRMDNFRKECSANVKEILISGIFSLAMACLILYMLPSDLHDISQNLIYQIITTIFAIVNLFVIQLTYRTTVIKLDDDDDVAHSKQIAKKLEWYRNYNPKNETKKAIKPAIVVGIVGVFGLILGQYLPAILAGVVVLYLLVFKTLIDRNTAKKSICREIEKTYPDWILELALLLQTDNMHVAIEKTLPTAPIILKQDLQQLSDDIITHPNDLTPYASFFSFLPLPTVHSSMKLLYSIAEFGAVDESVQLAELVKRNNTLMDKAEKLRNDDKVALVFAIKFVPTLASSFKMLLDLILFLFAYMSMMGA